MDKHWKWIFSFFIILFASPGFCANSNVVNVYAWSQEIPYKIIKQFEAETGIKVNHSTFDSNEILFAKLRAAKTPIYDVIEPSSYFVDHMRRLNMIVKLDRTKLPNFNNLDPLFENQSYDFHNQYSVPFIWGITGLVVNTNYFNPITLKQWSDLLDKRYLNQIMLLDDPREIFSIALLMLGYSINDVNPEHIHQAYLKLKELMPNVRLFNTDAVISILIDEDATLAAAWNGDFVKAHSENPKLAFVFPQEHFEIWVDNLAIPTNAPHMENAYRFINFLLRPDVAKEVSLTMGYSTANAKAKALLPTDISQNPVLYPPAAIFKRGEFETDMGEKTFALIERYWEKLKMGA